MWSESAKSDALTLPDTMLAALTCNPPRKTFTFVHQNTQKNQPFITKQTVRSFDELGESISLKTFYILTRHHQGSYGTTGSNRVGCRKGSIVWRLWRSCWLQKTGGQLWKSSQLWRSISIIYSWRQLIGNTWRNIYDINVTSGFKSVFPHVKLGFYSIIPSPKKLQEVIYRLQGTNCALEGRTLYLLRQTLKSR